MQIDLESLKTVATKLHNLEILRSSPVVNADFVRQELSGPGAKTAASDDLKAQMLRSVIQRETLRLLQDAWDEAHEGQNVPRPRTLIDQLQADYATGDDDLFNLSLLWACDVSDGSLTVKLVTEEVGYNATTLYRRRLKAIEVSLWPAIQALEQQAGINLRSTGIEAYLHNRIALWERSGITVDSRFVKLTMHVDLGPEAGARRWQLESRSTFNSLTSLLATLRDPPAFVLLGAPGAGKSTLLAHLEYNFALRALHDHSSPLPFMARLGQYGLDGDRPNPDEWLSAQWKQRNPLALPLRN